MSQEGGPNVQRYLLNNSAARAARRSNAILRGRATAVGRSAFAADEPDIERMLGAPTLWDAHDVAATIYGWHEKPPPQKVFERPNFVSLNRKSQGKANNSMDVSAFRKAVPLKQRTSSATRRDRLEASSRDRSLDNRTFGRPTMQGDAAASIRDIVQNSFELDWVREQASRSEKQAVQRKEDIKRRQMRTLTIAQQLQRKAREEALAQTRASSAQPSFLQRQPLSILEHLNFSATYDPDERRQPDEERPSRSQSTNAQISAFALKFRTQVAQANQREERRKRRMRRHAAVDQGRPYRSRTTGSSWARSIATSEAASRPGSPVQAADAWPEHAEGI